MSGKGVSASTPNPRFFTRTLPGGEAQFVGAMLTGAVSILPTPDRHALETLTKLTYSVTPYSDEHRLAPAGAPGASPFLRHVGDPSPIKHVFYVIRENRTYDQVLGDLERGNGDPTLTLFGESVTPNAHALVREFGVLDNFYVDAEVSYDGHAWSTGAYATDIVEKFWPTNYARRGASYLSEGGGQMRNAYGNAAAPLNGYIWDAVVRKGLTVRSYGEFADWGSGAKAAVRPGGCRRLRPCPAFRDVSARRIRPGTSRLRTSGASRRCLQEFEDYDAAGQVPRSPSSGWATITPTARVPGCRRRVRWSPRTTSRSGAWSARSRRAASGRNRQFSSSKTTHRTVRTTSTRIDRLRSSSARSRAAASSTAPCTRRRGFSARWS
jgi:hypothetical protein